MQMIEWRKSKDWTLKKLSTELEKTTGKVAPVASLSKWERGVHLMPPTWAASISDISNGVVTAIDHQDTFTGYRESVA